MSSVESCSTDDLVKVLQAKQEELNNLRTEKLDAYVRRNTLMNYTEITTAAIKQSEMELDQAKRLAEETERDIEVDNRVFNQKLSHQMYAHEKQFQDLFQSKKDEPLEVALQEGDEVVNELLAEAAGIQRARCERGPEQLRELVALKQQLSQHLAQLHATFLQQNAEAEVRYKEERMKQINTEGLALQLKLHMAQEQHDTQMLALRETGNNAISDLEQFHAQINEDNAKILEKLHAEHTKTLTQHEGNISKWVTLERANALMEKPLPGLVKEVEELNKKIEYSKQREIALNMYKRKLDKLKLHTSKLRSQLVSVKEVCIGGEGDEVAANAQSNVDQFRTEVASQIEKDSQVQGILVTCLTKLHESLKEPVPASALEYKHFVKKRSHILKSAILELNDLSQASTESLDTTRVLPTVENESNTTRSTSLSAQATAATASDIPRFLRNVTDQLAVAIERHNSVAAKYTETISEFQDNFEKLYSTRSRQSNMFRHKDNALEDTRADI